MIYTSYFGNIRKLSPDVVLVSIALYPPRWYQGLCYKRLAPASYILQDWKSSHDTAWYTEQFSKQVLSRLSPQGVVRDLMDLSGGKNVVLLCFEKPTDFCHRHLVSAWLRIFGYDCREL